jgi:hypothetical protein
MKRTSRDNFTKIAAMGIIILSLVSLPVLTLGQTTGSGTINGALRDSSQGALPGASVTIHNTDTGIDRSLSTNEAGLYSALREV